MQKHLSVWLTMLWLCGFAQNQFWFLLLFFASFLWGSVHSFWTNGELWTQRFKPPSLFEFHEGEAKLLLHCLKLLCSSSVTSTAKQFFSWSVLRGCKRSSGVRPFCEKALHPFQLLLCLSRHLTAFFFPTLPSQICYAFRSPFLSPASLYWFCFPSYLRSTFISLPPLAIFLQKRQSQMRPPCTKLWNVGVCLTSVPFVASTPVTVPSIPPSPGTAFYSIFTCFTRLPLLLCSTVGHCAPHFSIHQLLPIFPCIAPFPYPVRPCSFQILLMPKLLPWKGHQRPISASLL